MQHKHCAVWAAACRTIMALWGLTWLCSPAMGTDFDAFNPDKTGKQDVSGLLQEAVNKAAGTDRTLVLSPGSYWIGSPVVIQGNGFTLCSTVPLSSSAVRLQGYGAHVSRKALRGPDAPPKIEAFLKVKKPSYSLTVAGLSFDYAVAGIAGDYAVAASKILHCGFADCDYGIRGDPLQIVTIDSCHFSGGRFGIRGRETEGLGLNRSNLVNIYNCTFRGMSDVGIQIEGSPTNIRDCDFEGIKGTAIELLDSYVSNVVGSYFEGCGDETHPLVRIAPYQLPPGHNGQLNFHGNQVNVNKSATLIHVAKGCQLHAYDNRLAVRLSQGQQFVVAEEPGPHVRFDQNRVQDPAIP